MPSPNTFRARNLWLKARTRTVTLALPGHTLRPPKPMPTHQRFSKSRKLSRLLTQRRSTKSTALLMESQNPNQESKRRPRNSQENR